MYSGSKIYIQWNTVSIRIHFALELQMNPSGFLPGIQIYDLPRDIWKLVLSSQDIR